MDPMLCVKSAEVVLKFISALLDRDNLEPLQNELRCLNRRIEAVKEYLSLIHNDIDTLLHAPFHAAIDNLNYAINANLQTYNIYIQAALDKFIEASAIEKNQNLIICYLGISLCQFAFQDYKNMRITLDRIRNVSYVTPPIKVTDIPIHLFFRFAKELNIQLPAFYPMFFSPVQSILASASYLVIASHLITESKRGNILALYSEYLNKEFTDFKENLLSNIK